ncbi:ABC transporter ATP-binding protein [Allonocardiopsis opalescens]|uniref:ABC-2 type transport system ATP-binding protein n=1 Tax=Allonocardiopsis opalescens TaxID=1144618 RepID=A0A2T0QFD4_9ACTN|nr:ABC transporter ATP-binding protein [Allonocardiopsis opalescens]PRY02647.1 ABC-2 type transport system ATP-binding protein [Allonocardiopsis opalescens]
MPERPPAIVARGIQRAFGRVQALRGVDLTVPYGEVTALVGPNGAGKTTLLLILATLLMHDDGGVSVAGHDPVEDPGAVRAKIGWMPDSFGVYDQLTTDEYLTFFADAYRLPAAAAARRIAELLELVHLTEYRHQPVHVLSRGQKQRLGVARSLVHEPEILLLDEPASGLDPRSRVELRDLLRGLAADGAAVLVSSHILAELSEMADRVVFVADGVTAGEHRLDELTPATHRWRIQARDPDDLAEALSAFGVTATEAGGGHEVELDGDDAAADLLADLVTDGVRVTAFTPLGRTLEDAYLDLTDDRR